MKKNDNVTCPSLYQKQCLNTVNSYACKLRFFNGRCLNALKSKNKCEDKKNDK